MNLTQSHFRLKARSTCLACKSLSCSSHIFTRERMPNFYKCLLFDILIVSEKSLQLRFIGQINIYSLRTAASRLRDPRTTCGQSRTLRAWPNWSTRYNLRCLTAKLLAGGHIFHCNPISSKFIVLICLYS